MSRGAFLLALLLFLTSLVAVLWGAKHLSGAPLLTGLIFVGYIWLSIWEAGDLLNGKRGKIWTLEGSRYLLLAALLGSTA